MPIDREATLKQAEKLLRQGKLDGAIAEYVRLVEDQPRDWNAINALGDLYVRAGDADRAAAQYTRIAEYLFQEGFFPKAAALYKKALKVRSDHEPTLLQLADIAARQGVFVDARQYLRQVAALRRGRGDERGAAECLIRLGTLEDADADAQLAAARAAAGIGDTAAAVSLFRDAAEGFGKQQKAAEALEALVEAARLDPGDAPLRARVARDLVSAGQIDRARDFLTRESAGDDPDLLLALARMALAGGRDQEAQTIFTRVLTVAPDRQPAVLNVATEMASGGYVDAAYGCLEVVVDHALLGGEFDVAVDALQSFLQFGPHVPALVKLVELAIDAGRDAVMREAQAQLADAYLDGGQGAEARVIAEDLVAWDPKSEVNVQRLRRALELLGVENPGEVIRAQIAAVAPVDDLDLGSMTGGSADLQFSLPEPVLSEPACDVPEPPRVVPPTDNADLAAFIAELDNFPMAPSAPVAPAPPPSSAPGPPPDDQPPADDRIVLDLEVDLSDVLANIGSAPAPVRPEPKPQVEEPISPPDLETVFQQIRTTASREQQVTQATEQYDRAMQRLEQGQIAEAMVDLQGAARVPMMRFKAAAQLARLLASRGDLEQAVDWFERAAEAPAPRPEDGFAVLYDLAAALERMGEASRALAVLMEIAADAEGFRDVHDRIAELTRATAGGRT